MGVGVAVLLHRPWKKAVSFTEIEGAPGWGQRMRTKQELCFGRVNSQRPCGGV